MMRALPALAGALLVSACGKPAEKVGEIPEESKAGAATFQMGPGLYAVGNENTVYALTRLSADGTYVDMTAEGEEVGGGTWETRDDMICFDPAGDAEDQAERCWTNGPVNENGSFLTSRVDKDESYTVTPLDDG